MMGQTVRKMRRGTTIRKVSSGDSEMSFDTSSVYQNDKNLQQMNKKDRSSSSQWITELPTRSSSVYSQPTGYSSFVTTEDSKATDASSLRSKPLPETQAKPKLRKTPSDRTQGSTTASSSNTSRDHPPFHRVDMNYDDYYSHQAALDHLWQGAVNVFLQHDPIAKTPKHKTHAAYLIRRNCCYIKRDAGFRWKKSVEQWQARRRFPSIPIPNSEFSEA